MPEITCPVAAAAQSSPDALAIRSAFGGWTYSDWNDHVQRTVSGLRAMRVVPGDRVAIMAGNSREYLTLLVALWRICAVPCPVNVRWPADRIASVITSEPGAASGELLRVSHVIADPGMDLPIEHHSLDSFKSAEPEVAETPAYNTGSHASVYFTSGSSDVPKAVLHTIGNHHANARASNANIPLAPGDCWLLSLPLYHVSGMGVLWRCALAGATIAVPAPGEELDIAISRYGVSHVSVVTTQLQRLLNSSAGVRAVRELKAILLGGSAVPPSLIDRARAMRAPLFKTYGLTEAASQVATTRPNDPPEALYSSGKPIIADSVQIRDDGHILVHGETRFEGYMQGDTLVQPFDPDGWFDTRDLGEWTPEGYLRVVGRSDNMFISGGENVQPEEVERALGRIDGVEEAIVVPVLDDEYGQRGVAFLRQIRPIVDLEQQLRAMLPGYMIPKQFLPWPEEFADTSIKTDRARLRELLRTH